MQYSKMKDAGIKVEGYGDIPMKLGHKKQKTEYERIRICAKDFPYLHSKEVGEECVISVKIRKTGESEPEKYENAKENYITLEILQIAEPEEMDEYGEMIESESKRVY